MGLVSSKTQHGPITFCSFSPARPHRFLRDLKAFLRIRRGHPQPLLCKTRQRGCRPVLAAAHRVRWRLERHQNPASPGLYRRSSLEPAGNGGPTHTGSMGAVDLPHSRRSVQRIVWLLVVFAFLAFAALSYLRRSNMKGLLAQKEHGSGTEAKGPVVPIR